ncbi:GTD2B protein, partial [Amia calva]|nr:GTD2B protein [Amia calva]
QLELIDMQCDDMLRNHQQRSLDQTRFPHLRPHAKRMLSLFGLTYICEQTFSLVILNKGRLRTSLTDSPLTD